MNSSQLLVTGDYWHEDFRQILQQMSAAVTLQPFESVVESNAKSQESLPTPFELVLVAVSRPDQFSNNDLQLLQTRFSPTPVILLVGSWCEGELRSGSPPMGIPRVYWHQWHGRFNAFESAIAQNKIHEWLLDGSAKEGERIIHDVKQLEPPREEAGVIAVSALTEQSFDMVADAAKCLGYACHWTEYLEWDGRNVPLPNLLCVDADSWASDTQKRIKHLQDSFGDLPCVLLLNYPRQEEIDQATCEGVKRIVSKPFRLSDLQAAFETCLPGKVS